MPGKRDGSLSRIGFLVRQVFAIIARVVITQPRHTSGLSKPNLTVRSFLPRSHSIRRTARSALDSPWINFDSIPRLLAQWPLARAAISLSFISPNPSIIYLAQQHRRLS